ncbi:unnamed protein product [Ostreobium quekettii]|uniref:Uncharacterized protein n=1 Tax=Ostreobium quekettii TaxID=121088 RepID=A0A8S1J7R3_9CHLO|nr:unnamed protein product [Ostreobium quekettii]
MLQAPQIVWGQLELVQFVGSNRLQLLRIEGPWMCWSLTGHLPSGRHRDGQQFLGPCHVTRLRRMRLDLHPPFLGVGMQLSSVREVNTAVSCKCQTVQHLGTQLHTRPANALTVAWPVNSSHGEKALLFWLASLCFWLICCLWLREHKLTF